MKTSKIQRPKNTEKIRRVDVSHATFSFFVTAANKRNSRNFVMKRYKIKAHGEKEILKKSVKVKKMLNKRKLRKRQNLNFLKWRRTM